MSSNDVPKMLSKASNCTLQSGDCTWDYMESKSHRSNSCRSQMHSDFFSLFISTLKYRPIPGHISKHEIKYLSKIHRFSNLKYICANVL